MNRTDRYLQVAWVTLICVLGGATAFWGWDFFANGVSSVIDSSWVSDFDIRRWRAAITAVGFVSFVLVIFLWCALDARNAVPRAAGVAAVAVLVFLLFVMTMISMTPVF